MRPCVPGITEALRPQRWHLGQHYWAVKTCCEMLVAHKLDVPSSVDMYKQAEPDDTGTEYTGHAYGGPTKMLVLLMSGHWLNLTDLYCINMDLRYVILYGDMNSLRFVLLNWRVTYGCYVEQYVFSAGIYHYGQLKKMLLWKKFLERFRWCIVCNINVL